jgi:tRNA threonylcarbamoyl adenosine modification protein YeaZ
MPFLLIDTCTERGIIAYGHWQNLLFEKELPFGLSQSKFLMPYLAEALQPLGFPPSLQAIGVAMGPGSYTGIRLGVAVAQALAYSWRVPLVGVSSLDGFVPSETSVHFAAILDARIGGVYFQKGWSRQEGIRDEGHPQVMAWEEVGAHLEGVTHLVTPSAKALQTKFRQHYPDREWIWEEKAPSASALLRKIEQRYEQGKFVVPPNHLDLLYLRQTEAEREKNRSQKAE